jgi:DNA-binding NtrC family response regulator
MFRVVEFRKLRAEAEKELGRPKAFESAQQGVDRLETLLEAPSQEKKRGARTAFRLSGTNLPILLTGDDDTGKVELAREIHRASLRAKGPCIVVPCEHLVFPASDLAGHVEGAWSGATQKSLGLVQGAEGGTLILDRVDELEPAAQRLLLRIVDGRIRPVGESHEKSIDVRIVATCRDTARLIDELRHRLSGAVIPVLPLRKRPEDIVRVVHQHLAGRRRVTPDALAELLRRPWQGNLSELRATLDRLVAHSQDLIGRKLVLKHSRTPKSSSPAPRVDKAHRLRQMAAALS